MTANKKVSSADVLILNSILQKIIDLVIHVDTQINIMMVFSSAIFLFSTAKLYDANGRLPLYIITLVVFSGLSIIVSLMAIHPPRFMRKKGQKESMFYHRRVQGFPSADQYVRELSEMFKNRKKVVSEYGREVYNLSKYYYRPKRELYKLARSLLIIGFFLSVVFLLLGY